jgi:hypothetical protein
LELIINKNALMKKLFAFLIVSVAMVSCYKDYVTDFTYSSVYFPNNIDVRTVVVGEGLKIKIGADLGGVMENKMDRNVNFKLDNTLITPAVLVLMKANSNAYIKNPTANVATLLPLPASYYTLSNTSQIVIKAGMHTGTITLKVDSTAFLADAATLLSTYIVPFYITSADADTILAPKRSALIGIKYENMLFGNYLHGGVATVDSAGTIVKPLVYVTTKSQDNSKIWTLTTIGPNVLVSNGYGNAQTTKKELQLTLNGTDVVVSTGTGSTNTYLPDGASTFNNTKLLQERKIFLNYKYVVGVKTFHCQDTLTFRNRIRDGVNEWQDEDPSHYVK